MRARKRGAPSTSYDEIEEQRYSKRLRSSPPVDTTIKLPFLPDDVWHHIASCSPDVETWLNLALAIPTIGRWSMSKRGVETSTILFSSVESKMDSENRSISVTFFKNGKIHRDGDKPARVLAWRSSTLEHRTVMFYKNNLMYREGDRPATVGLYRANKESPWHINCAVYFQGYDICQSATYAKKSRDCTLGPAKLNLFQDSLLLRYYKDDQLGRNDLRQPSEICYSRFGNRKVSTFVDDKGCKTGEVYESWCEFNMDDIWYEMTKNITTNDEDIIFDWDDKGSISFHMK